MNVTLSPQKKQELEQMHDSDRNSRVYDRIKAVLLAPEDWSCAMISQTLRIHETTGRLTRLNLIGALSLENIGAAVTETYETINSESIVRFFWKLKKGHCPLEQKVHLILDGAAKHQTELVNDAAKVLNIELHYLPPYSPNLNPIKRLWKVMNEHTWNNVYFSSKKAFISAVKEFFDVALSEVTGSLESRITDNFQLLKPASSS